MAVPHAIVIATRFALEAGNTLSQSAVASIRVTLERLAAVGVKRAAVVDGRYADALREQLALHELPELHVEVIANLSWKALSGSAVLLACDLVEGADRCLVVRGDRPLALEQLRALVTAGSATDISAVLAVASAEATERGIDARVEIVQADDTDTLTVSDLGEDLEADHVFTGHAVITRDILTHLQDIRNPSIEQGLLSLAMVARVTAMRTEWAWSTQHRVDIAEKVDALLETKRLRHYTLLNPGPVNTTAHVKSSMVHHDVCHRDAIFSELMVSMTGKLRRIFRASPQHTVVTLTGSGTSTMEAALASTVPPERKVLIVDNGAFGARLVEVAEVHEMDIVHLKYEWGEVVVADDIERALTQYPEIAVVAMIHHETSVGLLNPVREIGAICRRADALLIVDAVSSLGAEDIDVVRDNIDVCYASANKCLHAISGAAFACIHPRVWPRIENLAPRAYYLDLRRYRRYMDDLAQTPFTPAVSTYFALDAACDEFLADGHAARLEMYRDRNRRLRDGLTALGMPSFTHSGVESHSIVTARLPEGVAFDALYEAVKARGIVLYGCKGVLADRYMQIANMGHLADDAIEQLLRVLAEEITRLRGRNSQTIARTKTSEKHAG